MNLYRALSRGLLVFTVTAAGHAQAANGDLLEIAWAPDGTFARDTRIGPGRFLEVCGRLRSGMAIHWRFEARRPVDFNIHFHEGKQVHYPARLSAVAKATDTFTAPVGQDYCWMWTNTSAAEVRIGLSLREKNVGSGASSPGR